MNLAEIQKLLKVQDTCQTNSSRCETNSMGEDRPVCNGLPAEMCNVTNNCFWDGVQCAQIGPAYCGTSQASQNISACRKGGNDFCFWQENTCQVCNDHEYAQDNEFKNLISMDGRSCFPEKITCYPYFRQKKHAACRKYCEIYQGNSNVTYTCEKCANGQLYGYCINNSSRCPGHTHQIPNGLIKYFGETSSNGSIKICTNDSFNVSGTSTNSVLTGITLVEYTFANPNNYHVETLPNQTQYITYECPEPRVRMPYQPLFDGETGASYNAFMEQADIPKRAPAFVCVCPPTYFANGTFCYKCWEGSTTYTYNAKFCSELCNSTQVFNGTGCAFACPIDHVPRSLGQSWYSNDTQNSSNETKICMKCPIGYVNIDNQCEPVPRSYYADQKNQEYIQLEVKRCNNSMTTDNTNSFSLEQCTVPVPEGMKINSTGHIANTCDPGTYEEGIYCNVCDPGMQIDPARLPETSTWNDCTLCPRGTYKSWFSALCKKCSGPSTVEFEGATSKYNCTRCASELVLEDLSCAQELKCTNAHSCIFDGRCISKCPEGFGIQDKSNRVCTQCPEGYLTGTNNFCVKEGASKTNLAVTVAVPIVVIILLIVIALSIFFGIKAWKSKANKLIQKPKFKLGKQKHPLNSGVNFI